MKKRYFALGLIAVLTVAAGTTAYVVSPTVHTGVPGEAPELGRTGQYAIGTTVKRFTFKGRARLTGLGAVIGRLETYDRTVSVRFWYPAARDASGQVARYEHEMAIFGKPPLRLVSQGIAFPGVAPLTGSKFPLVLMSHGYRGWDTQFSNLAEHIASRGYVVASIDHADMPVDGIASALLSFGNVLVDRTLDQRQVLAQILAETGKAAQPYLAQVDSGSIALIGYSMGGYGALSTVGAAYDFTNDPLSKLPDAAKATLLEASKRQPPIKALVTFAPWGGQPESRAWTAASLSKIKVPALIVVGDQDDVTNYKDGVSWVFDQLSSSDRHMLVYREARHNIVGNDFNLGTNENFPAYEFLNEPVWRSDRLNAINQHFVTAFLDLTLKGDQAKRSYLDVPTVDSNAAQWPVPFAEELNGTLAGAGQDKYWRGFQRRWATGLELHHKIKAKSAIDKPSG
jgi:predicted dienelactone hydrolase